MSQYFKVTPPIFKPYLAQAPNTFLSLACHRKHFALTQKTAVSAGIKFNPAASSPASSITRMQSEK